MCSVWATFGFLLVSLLLNPNHALDELHRDVHPVADDCSVPTGSVPSVKQNPTVARMQYEMVSQNPYRYTSDEVIFAVHAAKNGIAPADLQAHRAADFSKGQACLRASALGKRYGGGIHCDAESRVALYPRESSAYVRLSQDSALKQLKAKKGGR